MHWLADISWYLYIINMSIYVGRYANVTAFLSLQFFKCIMFRLQLLFFTFLYFYRHRHCFSVSKYIIIIIKKYYNSSWWGHEYLYQMLRRLIRSKPQITSRWPNRKCQGITKTSRIYPAGTMNVYRVSWQSVEFVEIFHIRTTTKQLWLKRTKHKSNNVSL